MFRPIYLKGIFLLIRIVIMNTSSQYLYYFTYLIIVGLCLHFAIFIHF